jgi:hypothetical protein
VSKKEKAIHHAWINCCKDKPAQNILLSFHQCECVCVWRKIYGQEAYTQKRQVRKHIISENISPLLCRLLNFTSCRKKTTWGWWFMKFLKNTYAYILTGFWRPWKSFKWIIDNFSTTLRRSLVLPYRCIVSVCAKNMWESSGKMKKGYRVNVYEKCRVCVMWIFFFIKVTLWKKQKKIVN